MRSIRQRCTTTALAFAALLAALATEAGGSPAATTAVRAGYCPFLSSSEADKAMGATTSELVHGSPSPVSGTCAYSGSPKRGAAPNHALTLAVYPPGLTGFKGFAKAVCKVSDSACKYARVLTVERNPLRYMRLLYAAASEVGNAVDFSGTFPGPGPAFLYEPPAPSNGSVMIFYVPRTKQFATVFCTAVYKPGGRDELCAFVAARYVYVELAVR